LREWPAEIKESMMVIVESICPTDAQHNTWRVVCRNECGVDIEFRTSSTELAVDYALRFVGHSRGKESKTEVARHVPNGNFRVLHQKPEKANRTERRRTNRVASDTAPILTQIATSCGQRMAKRRLELKLTQGSVAARVTLRAKSATQRPIERPMSRATYAMYELDAAEPSLKTMEGIASVLSVSPAWLAFGIGPRGRHSHSTVKQLSAPSGDNALLFAG
jgi:transcriptional regulator with XRE-family HTH domain